MSLRELELEGPLNKWVNIMKGNHNVSTSYSKFLKKVHNDQIFIAKKKKYF